jgi:hypothetical protein
MARLRAGISLRKRLYVAARGIRQARDDRLETAAPSCLLSVACPRSRSCDGAPST